MTLIEAVERGNIEEVKRLLSEKTDVKTYDRSLKIAIVYGHFEIVKLLIEHLKSTYNAKINIDEEDLISYDILCGQTEIVNYIKNQMLLEKINDIN
jgi:hypothetical protein